MIEHDYVRKADDKTLREVNRYWEDHENGFCNGSNNSSMS